MFTTSILELVASKDGTILPTFAATTPEAWADQQLLQRYGQVLTPSDDPLSFPFICHDRLKDERRALATWFDDSGKLSPMLQSVFMVNRLSGPIDDGFGWDFRPSGEPEQRMLVFKGTLMAVWRSAHLVALKDRHGGNMQFGGLATLVKSAYTERARLHTWRGYEPGNDARRFSGAEMSQRWVAHQTFLFLLRVDASPRWAWEASGSYKLFGPVDEKKGFP